jgi:putative flippase GtrA
MALVDADQYARVRQLLPEMLRFGVVGGIGAVFDLGGAALLHGKYDVEPLAAKGISTVTAMVITYVGSRFWTFKHRENQDLKREATLFIVLNLIGLVIAEAVVGFVTYVMGQHSQVAYNAGSFVGTGFGTIFRYVTYRKWVFPAPDEENTAKTAPAPQPFPDYAPWELDPAFLGAPLAPDRALPSAPAHSSRWGQGSAPAWDPAVAPTMSWTAPAVQSAPVSAPSTGPWPEPSSEPWGTAVTTASSPAAALAVPPWETSAPGPEARRSTPARSVVPRSSGGGRHRKS